MGDTLPASGHLGRQIGKFRLEQKLGSGAMGDVFLGVHVTLGSVVAIKILNRTATAEPGGVERFLNEARAVAAIGHENIAAVIDQDTLSDGTPYIVMQYVEGTTLRELLVERGALPLRQAVALTMDTLAALAAAHAAGIVHRDLKPENLRVTPQGRAKVLDFGVAKLLHAPTPALSVAGAIIGTPHYMAPEQVQALELDGRADLYAAGVMLFECCTGVRPFEAQNMMALLEKQVRAAPPFPRALRPEIPEPLEQVILRALEKTPERRFESAEQMEAALRALSHALPTVDGAAPVVPQPSAALYTPTRKEQLQQQATPQPVVETPTPAPAPKPRALWPLVMLALMLASGVTVLTVLSLSPRRGEGRGEGAVELPKETPRKELVAEVVKPPEPPEPKPEPTPQPAPPKPKTTGPKRAVKTPEPEPEPEKKPEPEPKPEAPKKPTRRPPDYDPKHFQAVAYLPRALALAREVMSDAQLINLDVEGVGPNGEADLTLSKEFEANFWFRSPSRSTVDARLPERDQDIPCKVYVEVGAKGIDVHVANSFDGCREKFLPPRRCSMEEAVKKALSQGARSDRVGKVTYLSDGTWMYDQGDGQNETVYFSCP